jgi:hypothetical protein
MQRLARHLIAAIAVTVTLAGCATLLEGAYEDQARRQCDGERPGARGACHDRVDEHRRGRE